VTLWTVACPAPLSMGLSWQENQSGLPFPPPGDLPNSGIQPAASALQVGSLPLRHPEKPLKIIYIIKNRESGFAIREIYIQNY